MSRALKGEARDNAWRVSAFAVWVSVLSLSFFFFTAENPFLSKVRNQNVFYLQICALAIFFCFGFGAARLTRLTSPFTSARRLSPQTPISYFFVYLLVTSLFATSPLSTLAYTVLTWLSFIMSAASWPRTQAGIREGFTLTTWLLLLIVAGLLLHLGYAHGRIIGGNQPNAIGQLAFVIIVCTLLGRRTLWPIGVSVGIFLILLVGSRSSAAALSVFLATLFLMPPYGKPLPGLFPRLALLALVMSAGLFLVTLQQDSASLDAFVEWLRLHDPESGLGSGLTGRTTLWSFAIDEIFEHPFLGKGFRVEFTHGGHSGYLSLIGETGIVGALMLLTAMVWVLCAHARKAAEERLNAGERWRSKVVVGFIASQILVLWVIEPMYISLGFPTQALLIYLLAKPLEAHRRASITNPQSQWIRDPGRQLADYEGCGRNG